MKLFSVLVFSVLLASAAAAQAPGTQPSPVSASGTESDAEAVKLFHDGLAAYENEFFEEAVSLFQQAADMEYLPAQYMLGECCYTGRGVKESRSRANELWQKSLKPLRESAAAGDAEANYLLGRHAENTSSFSSRSSGIILPEERYWDFYRKAADAGYVRAEYKLGDLAYFNEQPFISRMPDVVGVSVPDRGSGAVRGKNPAAAAKWYRKAAESGYAPAQYVMGRFCETGEGVDKDEAEALNWYRKAADAGYPRAIYRTGVFYAEGKAVGKDTAEAVKRYREAADAGYPLAQYVYGRCCDRGECGVEKNESEAFRWYKKAAEQSLPAACTALAECYANGRGVEYDFMQAQKWNRHHWDKSMLFGVNYARKRVTRHLDPAELEDFDNGLNVDLLYNTNDNIKLYMEVAESYFYGRNGFRQNYAQAVKLYRVVADAQRGGKGLYEMGFCYEFGKGVEADLEEAEKWYAKLDEYLNGRSTGTGNRTKIREMIRKAKGGDAETAYKLGLAFAGGVGVKEDMPEALKWFRAAEEKHPGAKYRIGRCYAEGAGVERNMEEAVKWYLKAAEQGLAEAQFELGTIYETGNGAEQDIVEAFDWYRSAAEQGLAEAQCALGNLCLKHEQYAKNIDVRLWFLRAAEQGIAEAQYRTGMYYPSENEYDQERRRKWLTLAAEQGYAPALYELARAGWRGTYRDKKISRELAAEYLIRAAEGNYAPAQLFLAECYQQDGLVKRNDAEAVKWYLRAQENGAELSGYAMLFLGRCHAAGTGVKQDKAEAVKWYRKAVEKDRTYTNAMCALGDCYYLGDGVPQDKAEAAEWYRQAAGAEPASYNYRANLMLAMCCRDAGDARYDAQAEKAMKALLAAEKNGNDREDVWLAIATCYEKGIGFPKDASESFRYCSKEIDRNKDTASPAAYMRLARCYRLGIGVEANREKAEELLLKAAMKGSPEAQVMLGDFYAEKKDDPVSCANALRWYQAAAERGYAPAVSKLAACYSSGSLGVRRNPDLTLELRRESAGRAQPVRDALREIGF